MTYVIMGYNNSIHSSTNFTPFEIAFGHSEVGNVFDIDRDRNFYQKLLHDHRKRLKVLYEYISDKIKNDKIKVREKKGGEEPPQISVGDEIFMKNTRTRKAKDLPRYEKAKVIGESSRNIVPVQLNKRKTRVAIKNVKRPPQVAHHDIAGLSETSQQPATSKTGPESGNNSDTDRYSSDEE